MTEEDRRRVVIVGGGFAGLFATRALRRAPVSVTLIDRAEHHLFQPLLYQCATGILSEGKIAAPLREVLRKHANVECVMAEVTGIDPDARQVHAKRPLGQSLEFGYDYLIVAAGVQQSYFGHDEFGLFAPGMKSIADALTIRRRVFGAFEMAESSTSHDEARRWLTFALVGGGPTGVELAGQIRELATRTLRAEFRHILPQDARVLLFDGGPAPLASFGPVLSAKAGEALRKLGVEQHMNSIVTKVDLTGLEVRGPDGEVTRHDVGTVLWTAGVEAPPLATAIATATGAQQDRSGRILVDRDLTIPGHPEITVAGDMMNRDGLPGVAEVAMQAGLYAARRIRRELDGQPPGKAFRYRDLGSAAYVARGNAVVSVGRLHLSGFLGWWAWLVIHIGSMTGFRNRFGALASWWFAFTRDLRRERTFTSRDVGVLRDVYGADTGQLISATKTAGAPVPPDPARSAGPGKPASSAP